jgi:hypothetical protein
MQTAVGDESRHEHLISSTENEAAHMRGANKILGGSGILPFKEVIKLEVKEFVIECTEGECYGP